MTITEFCTRHHACAEGRDWALEQGVETMAKLWERNIRPDWRIWIATRQGVLTPQQRVAFACRCVRRIWHLLKDERSRTAVETAERWARGEESDKALADARRKSRAARSASAARSACAACAAYAAACATAYAASAASAAYYSARSGDYADASYAAERDWQVGELVRMFGNPFRKDDDK